MEVKKLLKQLATVSGLDVTESPIETEIGQLDFDFTEIKSRTPAQTLWEFLE